MVFVFGIRQRRRLLGGKRRGCAGSAACRRGACTACCVCCGLAKPLPPARLPGARSYDSSLRADYTLAAPLNEEFPYTCGSSCEGWEELSLW